MRVPEPVVMIFTDDVVKSGLVNGIPELPALSALEQIHPAGHAAVIAMNPREGVPLRHDHALPVVSRLLDPVQKIAAVDDRWDR